MGNRATLKFQDEANQPNIYLHWNGGRASARKLEKKQRLFYLTLINKLKKYENLQLI